MNNLFASFFSKNESEIRRWVIYLGIFVTIAGLVFLAYLGFYNRYWSDDWCYNVDFKNVGVVGTVNTYFIPDDTNLIGYGYSNNRYSLSLLAGLLFELGITGAKITAILVIACWLIGLLWVLFNLANIFKFPFKSILFQGGQSFFIIRYIFLHKDFRSYTGLREFTIVLRSSPGYIWQGWSHIK